VRRGQYAPASESPCIACPSARSRATSRPFRGRPHGHARATLAEFLAVAERDMKRFPGPQFDDWKPYLHHFVEYRDRHAFDHVFAALRTAGLR